MSLTVNQVKTLRAVGVGQWSADGVFRASLHINEIRDMCSAPRITALHSDEVEISCMHYWLSIAFERLAAGNLTAATKDLAVLAFQIMRFCGYQGHDLGVAMAVTMCDDDYVMTTAVDAGTFVWLHASLTDAMRTDETALNLAQCLHRLFVFCHKLDMDLPTALSVQCD